MRAREIAKLCAGYPIVKSIFQWVRIYVLPRTFTALLSERGALDSDVLDTSVKPLAHPLKHLVPESHTDYVATSGKLLS